MAKTRNTKASRVFGSVISIVWCIGTLIFFNFFSDYIAYYHDGIRETLITTEFSKWLWIHNPTLILNVVGHSISLAFDRYILRESFLRLLSILGIASTSTLLAVFPFDFSVLPSADVVKWVELGLRIALILSIVMFSVETINGGIKFIRNLVKSTTEY